MSKPAVKQCGYLHLRRHALRDSTSTCQRSFLGFCEAMPTNRRFPPPWSVEDTGTGSAFVVKDGSGQKLAYVYYEEEPGRRSAAKMLTKDEARGLRLTLRSCRSC
jgi:hypothetical protein